MKRRFASMCWYVCAGVFSILLVSSQGQAQNSKRYRVMEVKNGGELTGKVLYKGKAPKPKVLKIAKDLHVCGKSEKYDESLIVDAKTGGLKNAVVWLEDIEAGKGWDYNGKKPELDQNGCVFIPHVLVVPVKKDFYVLNNDGILHNIHTVSKLNRSINKAQPKFAKRIKLKFRKPEFVMVKCDVHNWMKAWVVVAKHPYYVVTDDAGTFSLGQIPPGKYTVKVWHETLGEQSTTVEIKANQSSQVEFVYTGK